MIPWIEIEIAKMATMDENQLMKPGRGDGMRDPVCELMLANRGAFAYRFYKKATGIRTAFFSLALREAVISNLGVIMSTLDIIPEQRALVVDDDPGIAKLVGGMLRKEGYLPTVLTDPHEVLSMLDTETFDLAFVDIKMPVMNGLTLASEIKDRKPKTEIVFMTGHGTFDNAIQAIKVGAYDYLRKPFSLEELEFCLRRFRERQELKRRMELVESRYFQLVQNIPSLIFVVRKDLGLEFINQACLPMLGFSSDEALSKPEWLLERIHSGDRKRVTDLFSGAFYSKNSRFSTECRLTHKDGHLIYALIKTIAREPKEEDTPERLEGIIFDITDRVFLEKAEVQRQKMKLLREVAGDVAHEIRNPLVSIGGFARRLQKKFPELSEGDIILRECERLEDIVKRIAGYLQPVEVSYRECSLNDFLENCIEQISMDLVEKGIRSQVHLQPEVATVYMDPEVLSQIILDLLRSILKGMGEGDHLYIRTYEGDENVYMEFRSRFPREKQKVEKELLSPFDPDAHAKNLPLTYKLLRKMGGLLSFAQEEMDRVFAVALPKRPPRDAELEGTP